MTGCGRMARPPARSHLCPGGQHPLQGLRRGFSPLPSVAINPATLPRPLRRTWLSAEDDYLVRIDHLADRIMHKPRSFGETVWFWSIIESYTLPESCNRRTETALRSMKQTQRSMRNLKQSRYEPCISSRKLILQHDVSASKWVHGS